MFYLILGSLNILQPQKVCFSHCHTYPRTVYIEGHIFIWAENTAILSLLFCFIPAIRYYEPYEEESNLELNSYL